MKPSVITISRLFAYLFQNNSAGSFELPLNDRIFLAQAKTIQEQI